MSVTRAICVALLLAWPHAANADDKAQCLDASSSAQDLQREKRLVLAREQLLVCARATCPAIVQRDCATWLAELDIALPTIVVAVKDSRGGDVLSARVLLDGKPYLEQSAGTAVAIDPGAHVLRVEPASGPAIDQQVVIREGEKNRLIEIRLPDAPAAEPRAATPPQSSAPPESAVVEHAEPHDVPSGTSTRRIAGIVTGGLGIGALAASVVFGVKAKSKWDDAKAACGTGCAPDSAAYDLRDDARSAATISTVTGIVGVLAVGAGAVLFVTGRTRATVTVGTVKAGAGGVIGLEGTF